MMSIHSVWYGHPLIGIKEDGMTNTNSNSLDRVTGPGQSSWGLAVMLATLLVATAVLLVLAIP